MCLSCVVEASARFGCFLLGCSDYGVWRLEDLRFAVVVVYSLRQFGVLRMCYAAWGWIFCQGKIRVHF